MSHVLRFNAVGKLQCAPHMPSDSRDIKQLSYEEQLRRIAAPYADELPPKNLDKVDPRDTFSTSIFHPVSLSLNVDHMIDHDVDLGM